jgi:hypothetical protein
MENKKLNIHDLVIFSYKDDYKPIIGYISKFTKTMIYVNRLYDNIIYFNKIKNANKLMYQQNRRYEMDLIKIDEDILKKIDIEVYNVFKELKGSNEL